MKRISVRIYPFFWFLAAAIGWINSLSLLGTAIWVVVIVISVLIHEYGHALTALIFGQEAQIELVGFGGVTRRQGAKLKLWQEFLVVFDGPLAGFLLFLLAWLLERLLQPPAASLLGYALGVAIYANFFWTILNLLPIFPLDGGHLFSIFLESLLGFRGVKVALFTSVLLSAALSMFFFAIQAFLAGALFLLLTYESYRSWKGSLSITEQDQDNELQNLLHSAESDIEQGNWRTALDKLQTICQQSQAGLIYLTATQYMAKILTQRKDYAQAYKVLAPLRDQLSLESLCLLHQLAYYNSHWKEAIELGTRCYQQDPSYHTALINAICYAILGEAKPAIGWLNCSIRDGLPEVKQILSKREFDNIRSADAFRDLEKKYD